MQYTNTTVSTEIRVSSESDSRIHIQDVNGREVTVDSTGLSSLGEALGLPAVISFFGREVSPDMVTAISLEDSYTTAEPAVVSIILSASVGTGGQYIRTSISAAVPQEQRQAAEQAQARAQDQDGQPGTVTIIISGGLAAVQVPIICGRTTITEALQNQMFRARSLMPAQKILDSIVILNDVEADKNRTLHNGDTLMLAARVTHEKGATEHGKKVDY